MKKKEKITNFIEFKAQLKQKIKAFFTSKYPEEAGVIWRKKVSGKSLTFNEEVIFLENKAKEKTKFFEFDTKLLKEGDIFIHSHTNGKYYPSIRDIEFARAHNIPCGIALTGKINSNFVMTKGFLIFNDGELWDNLFGRTFIPNVYDCFSFVRSYYLQMLNIGSDGFLLEPFWWRNQDTKDIINQKFNDYDFQKVPTLKKKDIIVYKIKSKVPNHMAVYLGDGKIAHHLVDSVSKVESAEKYEPFKSFVLRYKKIEKKPQKES